MSVQGDTEDEFEGQKTISGKLGRTKGNQLILNDVFLIVENREERKALEEKYFNKRLEVTGDVYVHRCEPEEECPEEGYMRYMTNIKYPD